MAYIKDVQVGSDVYLIQPDLYFEASGQVAAVNNNPPYYSIYKANFELIKGTKIYVKILGDSIGNDGFKIGTDSIIQIKNNGNNIIAGQLKDNKIYGFIYDGTYWQLEENFLAIKNITRDGTTFTATRFDGSTFTFEQRDNNTTYSAGTGLTLDNTKFNHSNSITAKTAYADTATTVSANGGKIKVTDIKYDAQGHVTGSQDRTITLSQTTYSLSGLSGIGTINASGTAPLTLSGSKSGTTYTLTGSIADASASASGVVNTDAQVFSGVKTFDNGIHVYGTISTQGTTRTAGTMYPGGAYHSGHNSIVLHGDTSGVSGIGFTSEKATKSGTTTNINSSSDRAFIQYHAYGVTPAAEGTAPTLATSGESGVLVLGVGNDATDTIRLQAPGTAGILHQIGATAYPIPHTTNTNGTVGGTTTPVYVEAGVIKALSYTIAKSVPSDAVFTDHYAWGDITGKPTKITLTGAVTGNVSLGAGELSLATTVNHNHDDLYKIASGVITLGSNTITPITSIAELTGSTITAANLRTNLGLSAALRFIGKATTDMSESTTTAPTVTGVTNYVPEVGDVVLDKNSDAEYVCIAKSGTTYTWELLGRSGSWATSTHTHGNITNGGLLGAASMAVVTDGSKKITTADLSVSDSNASTNATTTFVQAVTQNAQGKITVTKASLNTSGTWSGNAATATKLKDNATNTTRVFYRGDNTWSNILKQTSAAALGIDTNCKIGTAVKDLHFTVGSGSGTGINDGNAGGITIGTDTASYGGIYWQSSGSYGLRLHFATTGSFANGAYTRMLITSDGKVGIGTLTPDTLLTVNGNAKADKFIGSLQGNADTATSAGKWTTARTLTIGNTGKSVDGSENVSWSLVEIGAAAVDHGTHVTTATVQSALGISSSGSGSKALTEKGTFVTFGTSNLTIGKTSSTAMAGDTTVTNVAISANVTTNVNYPIVFATSNKNTTAAKEEGLQKSGAKFYFNPHTGNVVSTLFNNLTLTAATTGFTIAGGTTSKTLTVAGTVTINTPTQWGIVYGGASGAYTSTAAGTSGQYLKSNGNAAPTWATFSASTVGLSNVTNDAQIPKSIGTTKGDIIYFDGNASPKRLAIGTNGEVLKIVSGIPSWETDNNDDTKNTAGSTDSTSKLFLIGAASQAANPQTYSDSHVFETNGAFSAKTLGVNADTDVDKVTLQWNSTDSSLEFVFA